MFSLTPPLHSPPSSPLQKSKLIKMKAALYDTVLEAAYCDALVRLVWPSWDQGDVRQCIRPEPTGHITILVSQRKHTRKPQQKVYHAHILLECQAPSPKVTAQHQSTGPQDMDVGCYKGRKETIARKRVTSKYALPTVSSNNRVRVMWGYSRMVMLCLRAVNA